MAIENVDAKNERLSDFASDFAAASLIFKDGATVLATHTLAGFGTPAAASVSANAIPDATIVADGEADTCLLVDGTKEYDLVIGVDVIITTNNFIIGQPSQVSSLTVTA